MIVNTEKMMLKISRVLDNDEPWVIQISPEDLANIQKALAFATNYFHRTAPELSNKFASTYQIIDSPALLNTEPGKEPSHES